jgi:hypothetical protein
VLVTINIPMHHVVEKVIQAFEQVWVSPEVVSSHEIIDFHI